MDPLKEAIQRDALTQEDFDSIFGNIKEIMAFSQGFLEKLKKVREEQGDLIRNIGSVLDLEMLSFKVYAPFCANLKNAIGLLNTKKESPVFLVEFETCQRLFNRNLNLESFMLKPMQRVTKLPLLVKGIIKHTAPEDEDYEVLQGVSSKTEEVVWFVNSECGKVDERVRLDRLQEQLSHDLAGDLGPVFLKSQNRVLLREGNLQRISPDAKLHVFLFNDLLLLTKEDGKQRFKLYARPLLLWLVEIQDADAVTDKRSSIKRLSKVLPVGGNRSSTMSASPSPGARNSPLLGSIESQQSSQDHEVNPNFVLNDQSSAVVYDLRAPSSREKMLWLEDIGIALKKLRHDVVMFLRLLELKDPRSDQLEVTQCLTHAGQFVLGGVDGIFASKVSAPNSMSRLGEFKKRVHQLQVVEAIDKFVTLEGKSGTIRVYPLGVLEDPAAPCLQKLEESGTVVFKVGQIGGTVHLASYSSKLTLYKYDPEAAAAVAGSSPTDVFVRLFDVSPGGSGPCRSIDFVGEDLVVALGSRFYTLDMGSQRLQEAPLGSDVGLSDPVAIKALDTGGEVLLCFSDAGLWLRGADHPIMHWSSPARSFARSGDHLFVFTTNYVEIWNWRAGRLVQAIRSPNIRLLNSYNSGLRPEFDKVEFCLVAVTYLLQPHPFLCKLEVHSQ